MKAILLLTIPLILRLLLDFWKIKIKKQEPDHSVHTVYTGLVMVIISLLHLIIFEKTFYQAFLLEWGIFWMVFDYALNLLRGLSWNYIDQGIDGKSSLADKLYKKAGWKLILMFKGIFLGIAIILYLINF